jgi:hypothetical protein
MVVSPSQLDDSAIQDALLVGSDPSGRSPIQWRDRLEKRLAGRYSRLRKYDEYYEGKHSIRFATEKFRNAFGFMFREFSDNFCDVIVNTLSARLRVDGIRLGEDQTTGDKAAWLIWQRNGLDAESEIAHTEAFVKTESYALVWWDQDGTTESPLAQITIEDPLEMIVECAAENRRKVLAAFKKWLGDDGLAYCELYLPTEIYKWVSRAKVNGSLMGSLSWVMNETPGERWPLPNPLGRVPVVALQNRPRLRAPISELHQVIPMQDFLNKILMDAAVASEYYAFPQRYIAGIEIPRDPVTNKPIEDLKMAFDRVWTSKDSSTQFGQFSPADLQNYVKLVDLIMQHIIIKSSTPPHYFDINGQFPSGDALKAAEAPLVRKARQRALHFGEAWEQVMRLAGMVENNAQLANTIDSEIIWGEFEIRSDAQIADALVKLKEIGVPNELLWELYGLSQMQILRAKQYLAEQPLLPTVIRETLTGPAPSEAEQIAPAEQQTQVPAVKTGG